VATVLVVDDERSICAAFSRFLELAGHTALTAANGRDALQLIEAQRPAAVFMDVRMPGMTGLDVLEKLRESHPNLPVIIMTAHGNMHTAMQAMRLGAFDYLMKPIDLTQVRGLLERALQQHVPAAESAGGGGEEIPSGTLVGNSPAMQEIFKLMGLLTTNDLTVLLTGESGVGKELVARAIHSHSPRRDKPFVAVNCAAIPENLLESELFGHEKGAFTGAETRRIGRFEAAEDGTLFLDEVGDLPLVLQGKLLRVLQERSYERVGGLAGQRLNARVIAATNRDLEQEIAAGNFREDLFYRLKLVTLAIPPLKKRKEDIESLSRYFLDRANRELGRRIVAIEPAALERLRAHTWPGNVRELEHTIKRAVLTAKGQHLTLHDLPLPTDGAPASSALFEPSLDALRHAAKDALRTVSATTAPVPDQEGLFHWLVAEVERELIAEALRMTEGNQVAAAKLLGLHRTTMRNKRRPE
jgi:nitrogen regulation protein NR(I)